MTAILLPVLLGTAGAAMDVTDMVEVKSQLQATTDSAALAVASAMGSGANDIARAKQTGKAYVENAMAIYFQKTSRSADNLKDVSVLVTPATESTGAASYSISVSATYSLPLNMMTHLLGFDAVNVSTSSGAKGIAASEKPNALSMYLVLDRSGSMTYKTDTVKSKTVACQNYTAGTLNSNPSATKPCYFRKIEAVQTAVETLMDQLETVDSSGDYVRTGAIAYNNAPFSPSNLAWGTSAARKYVADIPYYVTGGTDASAALETARKALTTTVNGLNEATEQARKGNKSFSRHIVLLTDGEMTGSGSQWVQSIDQKVRDQCLSAKNQGVTIYTIAFMAPEKGKSLLSYCATSAATFFEPENMSDLVAAFDAIGKSATDQKVRLTN